MPRIAVAAAVISLLFVTASACGGDNAGDEPAGASLAEAGDPATDKLAQVLARGTLVLSTDLKYPPQSFAVKRVQRPAGSACAANQLTAPEVAGYDADTAKLVAKALGVEPCFVAPSWTEITAGNWSDRWDIAYGSGAITTDRMARQAERPWIVAMTANAMDSDRQQCLDAGMNAYLAKPIQVEELVAAVLATPVAAEEA